MDRQRIVAGLDVHKDSIYLCVMNHDEAIIFQKTYGTLTPDMRQMCAEMVAHGVTEAAILWCRKSPFSKIIASARELDTSIGNQA